MDLRFATSLAGARICNVDPQQGDLGVGAAKLVVPGDPAHSVVSLRIHAVDPSRMPPVGRAMVHAEAARVVDDWIASLRGCP